MATYRSDSPQCGGRNPGRKSTVRIRERIRNDLSSKTPLEFGEGACGRGATEQQFEAVKRIETGEAIEYRSRDSAKAGFEHQPEGVACRQQPAFLTAFQAALMTAFLTAFLTALSSADSLDARCRPAPQD
jgi:hypothetical protein